MKISDFLFKNVGVPKFENFLDLSSLRHKLVSGNIANVSTPGYRGRDFDFRAEFERLSGEGNHISGYVTQPGHIPLGSHPDRAPDIEETKPGPDDLNGVDIDKEVARMAQNELHYTIAARLLQKKFSGLKKAIKGS